MINIKKQELNELVSTIVTHNDRKSLRRSLINGIEIFIDNHYALKNIESSSRIIRWVPLSEKEMPELCTEVLVRYTHDRSVAVRLFDGDGRFYNEIQDRDITDSICEWAALPE